MSDVEVEIEVEGWVREYLPAVHRYLRRRAPRDDVDDLVSEVFATAWRRRADVPREAVLPWLYRTAGFVLANHRRVRTDLAVGDAIEVGSMAGSTAGSLAGSLAGSRAGAVSADPSAVVIEDVALAAAWRQLSERDREVLMLTAWEGLSGRELAAVLGISVGGAGAAVFRARAALEAAWTAGERTESEATEA